MQATYFPYVRGANDYDDGIFVGTPATTHVMGGGGARHSCTQLQALHPSVTRIESDRLQNTKQDKRRGAISIGSLMQRSNRLVRCFVGIGKQGFLSIWRVYKFKFMGTRI